MNLKAKWLASGFSVDAAIVIKHKKYGLITSNCWIITLEWIIHLVSIYIDEWSQ